MQKRIERPGPKFDSHHSALAPKLADKLAELDAEDPRASRHEREMYAGMRQNLPALGCGSVPIPGFDPEVLNPVGEHVAGCVSPVPIATRRRGMLKHTAALAELPVQM